jgi:anti-sigma factor ChrR (cupin superfamily)
MNQEHDRLDQQARDRAALYALGELEADQRASFEVHLEGCELCLEEVSQLRPLAGDPLETSAEAEPPGGLRGRVLREAGSQTQREARPPFALLLEEERRWLASGTPGVEISQLWVDPTQQRQTILIRMQEGTSLPYHEHGSTEECFVIRGDLRDGNLRLGAGDYVRFDGGTAHEVSSDQGCLLLVSSSLLDRRLDERPSHR